MRTLTIGCWAAVSLGCGAASTLQTPDAGRVIDGGATVATDAGADAGPGADAGLPDAGLPDAGCRQVARFTGSGLALYEAARDTTSAALRSSATPPFDDLVLDVVHRGGGLTFPMTFTFSPASRRAGCSACLLYQEGCTTGPQTCRNYAPTAGSVLVTRADRATPGRMTATLTGVRFVEWDLVGDAPAGSRCIDVGAATFDLSW